MEEQKEQYHHQAQLSQGRGEANQNHNCNMKQGKSNASSKPRANKKEIRKARPRKAGAVPPKGPVHPIKSKDKKTKG